MLKAEEQPDWQAEGMLEDEMAWRVTRWWISEGEEATGVSVGRKQVWFIGRSVRERGDMDSGRR